LFAAGGNVAPLGNRDGTVNVGDALVALRFALALEMPTQEDISYGEIAPLCRLIISWASLYDNTPFRLSCFGHLLEAWLYPFFFKQHSLAFD
jgi:hypothetical protein